MPCMSPATNITGHRPKWSERRPNNMLPIQEREREREREREGERGERKKERKKNEKEKTH